MGLGNLRFMAACSRPNFGTVSRIQFKYATGITTQVESRDNGDITPKSEVSGQGHNVT